MSQSSSGPGSLCDIDFLVLVLFCFWRYHSDLSCMSRIVVTWNFPNQRLSFTAKDWQPSPPHVRFLWELCTTATKLVWWCINLFPRWSAVTSRLHVDRRVKPRSPRKTFTRVRAGNASHKPQSWQLHKKRSRANAKSGAVCLTLRSSVCLCQLWCFELLAVDNRCGPLFMFSTSPVRSPLIFCPNGRSFFSDAARKLRYVTRSRRADTSGSSDICSFRAPSRVTLSHNEHTEKNSPGSEGLSEGTEPSTSLSYSIEKGLSERWALAVCVSPYTPEKEKKKVHLTSQHFMLLVVIMNPWAVVLYFSLLWL